MEEKDLVQEFSLPIFIGKGWMKFQGVLLILYGILVIFTIIGILICWIPIWMGALLIGSSNKIESARTTGSKADFHQSLSKIKTYFVINGVIALIGIIAVGIAIIVTGGAIFSILNFLK